MILLKIYQFSPEVKNSDVIINILVLAMMRIPSPDFNLCLGLIDVELTEYQNILLLNQELETCHFSKFWMGLENSGCKFDFTLYAGFLVSMRSYIIGVLLATYQKIQLNLLCEFLNISQKEINVLISENCWVLDGAVVNFQTGIENNNKTKNFLENINSTQVAAAIRSAL